MTALATIAGMIPLSLASGQRFADAAATGDRGDRRDSGSMVLSLIVTPAVHYYLSRH